MWVILPFSVTVPWDLFPTVAPFFFSGRSVFHCVEEAPCMKPVPR